MTAVLDAHGLAKRYRRSAPDQWALRDVNVRVEAGEIVSVIGRNGAGKSTLLKLACGVSEPTAGTLTRAPRVAPLIEVGAGFHPELSGRDNVGVNGRLLGMHGREIKRAFDDIVDFAELGHVIDRPVKEYSSGMYMRLGFAVAVHTHPDLLLVDEVLAVGDLPFQVKCLERIRQLRANGVGVLFVSHNLASVVGLASRALLLELGRPVTEGDPQEVVGAYHALVGAAAEAGVASDDIAASGELVIDRITVTDGSGVEPSAWQPGEQALVTLQLRATEDVDEGIVGLRLSREGAGVVGGWTADQGPFTPRMRAGESATVTLALSLNVNAGGYHLDVAIARRDWTALQCSQDRLYRFGVLGRPGNTHLVDLAPSVQVSAEATAVAG